MFETGIVRPNECYSLSQVRRQNRDIFSVLFNMKVYCVFSLESPHRGDSNQCTQYIIFNMKRKNTINNPKSAAMGFFSKGLKNEFETVVVNKPSVFKLLKFYYIMFCRYATLFRPKGVGRFRILGGPRCRILGGGGPRVDQIPSRHMTS